MSKPIVETYVYELTEADKISIEKYGHRGNPDIGYPIMEGERDPWLWPFSRTSIWNMPIGSEAKYADIGFTPSIEFCMDGCYMLTTKEDDEYLDILGSGMGARWPDDVSKLQSPGKTYWPRDLTISKDSFMNDCSTILQPDKRHYVQMQPTCRHEKGSSYVIGFAKYKPSILYDIYENGELGSHWGSGLSAIGGTIRLGELFSDEPIRHALKLNVWADKWLYWDEKERGYIWPADRSDTKPEKHADNPYLMEGSLVAIPRDLTPEEVGITCPIVKKMFVCLQDYGAYIVDDTVRDSYSLSIDYAAQQEVLEKTGITMRGFFDRLPNEETREYGTDFVKMICCLKVITNNGPDSIGGGGIPCQPLAPDLPKIK